MGTTLLIVEILIIGFQVLFWIILLFLDFFGFKFNVLYLIKENIGLSLILLTIMGYSLGIIFDSFIAWIFNRLKLDKHLFETKDGLNVINILHKNPEIHKFLDSQFSRYRLVRATLFNLPIITIVLTISILIFYYNEKVNTTLLGSFVLIFGILLTLITYKAWKARLDQYKKYVFKAYELLK